MDTVSRLAVNRLLQVLSEREGRSLTVGTPNGITLHRAGRNPVWRVDGIADTYYAKVMSSLGELKREANGYKIGQQIADEFPDCMAAQVILEDSDAFLLVTSEIPGTPVSEIFRSAYRLDKNPFVRGCKRNQARQAITQVCRWLAHFHSLPLKDTNYFYDHNVSGISRRINRVLNREHRGKKIGEFLELPHVGKIADTKDACMIFGDCTLGNFYIDGDRVGVIDFEDNGIGPSKIDWIVLHHSIEAFFRNTLYVSDPTLVDLIYTSDGGMLETFIRLDLCLLEYEQYLGSSTKKAGWERRNKNEIRQLSSKFPDALN